MFLFRQTGLTKRVPTAGRRQRRRPFVPTIELLEGRLTPSTVVTDTAELRTAIAASNAGGDHTILLEAGRYGITDDGQGTFTITNNITIEGAPGATPDQVVLNGKGTDRVFYIQPALEGTYNATIAGVTIEFGDAHTLSNNGGGIAVADLGDNSAFPLPGVGVFNLNLSDSIITNSQAVNAGGGISIHSGSLVVTDCEIGLNTAQTGGAAGSSVPEDRSPSTRVTLVITRASVSAAVSMRCPARSRSLTPPSRTIPPAD